MRGCLKSHPPTPTYTPQGDGPPPRRGKCVAFELEAALETFFVADDWDRSPMEPSRKLSYQDLLELKEIQRTLPRANQPPDYVTGRAAKHYLKKVPIGLLPLLPASDSSPGPSQTSPTTPTPGAGWVSFNPSNRQQLETEDSTSPSASGSRGYNPVFQPPPTSNLHPSNLAPLPPRQKPRFAFLPLLDSPTADPNAPTLKSPRSRTPSPARSDPPTPSLTNASLESSPISQTSSCSVDPPLFHLSPSQSQRRYESYHHQVYPAEDDEDPFPRSLTSAMQSLKAQEKEKEKEKEQHSSSFGRSNPAFKPVYTIPSHPPTPSRPKCQRNVIFVNGVEIDLDGSDDEDEEDQEVVEPDDHEPLRLSSRPPAMARGQDQQPSSSSARSSPTRSGGGSSRSGSPSSTITTSGLPTPPESTSPSPTLTQRTPLPPPGEPESPFIGLHAPVMFKRRIPVPGPGR